MSAERPAATAGDPYHLDMVSLTAVASALAGRAVKPIEHAALLKAPLGFTPTAQALLNALSDHGRIVGQGRDQREFHVIRSSNPPDSSFPGTVHSMSVHTDGAYLPELEVDLVAMLCIAAAERGGESRWISASHVSELLEAADPDWHRASLLPMPIAALEAAPTQTPLAWHPIFQVNGCDVTVAAHPYRSRAAHLLGMARVDDRQMAVLNFLDAIPATEMNGALLEPGDVLLVDNRRALHGRTAFEEANEAERTLVRVWVSCENWSSP